MDGETASSGSVAFGRSFTDHMAIARFDDSSGWSDTVIVPFEELSLSPAAMVFHYGQAIFEGLKAFRQPDGGVALFRPHDHARRFDASAARLAMPPLPAGAFVSACDALVRADEASVPWAAGHSLYLRPLLFATEPALGVRPARQYLFAVIASPVGSYLSSGAEPINVWATADYSRAAPGGTGSAKCAGNYGASLAAKEQAAANGCDETLWLDATEHRWVEELGGMNVVLVARHSGGPSLVAPPVGGTVLDGITRRSLLELARRIGYDVVERPVAIEEVGSGSFVEAFACGTAAGVVSIAAVRSPSGETLIGDGTAGPVTARLRDLLIGLQQGGAGDPSGWRVTVDHTAPQRC